jgi:hypothetical protein
MSAAAWPESSPAGPPPERDALYRILRSEILDRAPSLILFLRYICEMQMAGRTEAIKEYNIAVEALGRNADFDQKKDSIVRVEAHRLRKRLAEYYRTVGADDPFEIVIPAGTYVPEFRPRRAAATVSDDASVDRTPVPGSPSPSVVRRPPRWIASLGVVAVIVIIAAIIWKSSETPVLSTTQRPPARDSASASSVTQDSVVRILAGGSRDAIADRFGQFWGRDRFFTGGEVFTAPPRPIRRTQDDSLYLTRRQGEFRYNVPVPPGTYEVRLHFAETVFGEDNVAGGGESSRIFQVQVNGGDLWTADIVSEAGGPNTATQRVYRGVEPGKDGSIHIAFIAGRKEVPFVNAIEVLPTPGRRIRPIRIVAGPAVVNDKNGREWGADRFWSGGQPVQRHEPVEGPEESLLFQGERYGNFSYAVPVASGTTYTLNLRFAETWFGPGRPGGGGEGSRVFDLYCNGRMLLGNFDVFREAGGPMRQLKRTFRGLEPNAQGKLNLLFVPVRNYAMVNAVEALDEGP